MFSALETIQAFGLGQQQAEAKRQRELAERTRMTVGERTGAGDYMGASQAAIEGGEYDLAGKLQSLDENQRQQALTEAQVIARAAAALKTVPPEQRPAQYQRMIPALKGAGFSDDELTQVDLSDEGLSAAEAFGQQITQLINPPKPGDAYTLNPGDVRFGPDGKELARSPYDPVVVADGVLYGRTGRGAAPTAPSTGAQTPDQLRAEAQAAIAAGADPAAVNARLQQLLGGQTASPSGNFPQ